MPSKLYSDLRWYINFLHWLRDVTILTAAVVAIAGTMALVVEGLNLLF